MSSDEPTAVPPNLTGLVDDAAVFPPGNAPLPHAMAAHRQHRLAWYSGLIGPLLLPASQLTALPELLQDGETVRVGVIADVAATDLTGLLGGLPPSIAITQIEAAATRGGAPASSGLTAILSEYRTWRTPTYAELPLDDELPRLLDRLADSGVRPKFRTGGDRPEMFPSPAELAGAMARCAERGLDFKLTAGLHHAIRHDDAATGSTHHGFLNVLVATGLLRRGADHAQLVDALGNRDADELVGLARRDLDRQRSAWRGFGSCSVTEPVDDLADLGLLRRPEPFPGRASIR